MELPLNYAVLFVFGLAIGSFINVISLRYQPGQKLLDRKVISGRSHCPICLKTLAWYELIQILSFFLQKGKCRNCGYRLSLQYPLVELLSGLIFVFIPWHLSNLQLFLLTPDFSLLTSLIWIIIFLLFLLLSIIDFRQYIIPNSINLSLVVLGIILLIINHQLPIANYSFLGHYAMLFDIQRSAVVQHTAAAFLAMTFFGLIIVLSRGKAMGWGDFKLAGVLGLIFGWPDIILVLFLAFFVGAFFSILLLIQKKKKIKEAVPFGPFLAIGAFLTFFFGYQIVDIYFRLFGL